MTKRISRRDDAANFQVPATKPGAIKALCSLPGHLEIFTPNETFKVQTPDSIDPERTNPNTLWVNAKTHDIGSASPFIARTIITAHEVLSPTHFLSDSLKGEVMLCMHNIKELFIQCITASDNYHEALTSEEVKLEASGYRLARGSPALAYFPVVPNLEATLTTFLITTRRLITEICRIPILVLDTVGVHTRLDHLIEKELKPLLGDDHPLVETLTGFVPGVERIVDLRNGQEHTRTTKGRKLVVRNYEMTPSNQIKKPVWYLEGEDAVDIASELQPIAEFLLRLSEATFIGSIFSILPSWPPYAFQKVIVPDPDCPVHYRLTIDASQLDLK